MLVPARRVHSESARQVPDSWSELEQAVFWYLTMLVRPISEGGLWAETALSARSTERVLKRRLFIVGLVGNRSCLVSDLVQSYRLLAAEAFA